METSPATRGDFKRTLVEVRCKFGAEFGSQRISVVVFLLQPGFEALLHSHAFASPCGQLLALLVGVDAAAFCPFAVFDAPDNFLDLRVDRVALPVTHRLELLDSVTLTPGQSAGTLGSESTSSAHPRLCAAVLRFSPSPSAAELRTREVSCCSSRSKVSARSFVRTWRW